jgi:arginyl-tRNA--protein-N-Asp/Glu arginylyltransferase
LLAFHKTLMPDSLPGLELDRYLALGWYRMHQTIFTTTHLLAAECWRVHWLRFSLKEISERATHRKIRKRNQVFNVNIEDFTRIRPDHEALYGIYRESIDFNGAISIQQSLLDEEDENRNIFRTKCISVFDGDKLIAGGYFDLGNTSGTSILHFFDPVYKRFGLGKFLMLVTVDYLKTEGYEFYYPGYVLAGNAKMDYKLFLGKEATQYYDPETATWRPFHDSILLAEDYSETEKLEVMVALLVGMDNG